MQFVPILFAVLSLFQLAGKTSAVPVPIPAAAPGSVPVKNLTYIISGDQRNVKCQNGKFSGQVQLQFKTSADGANNPPMKETGLPTIQMSFFVDGVAPTTFSVTGSGTSSGNTWTFALADDSPNLNAQLNMGPCTSNSVITTSVTTSMVNVPGFFVGTPNVADLVSFNGVPSGTQTTNVAQASSATSTVTTTTTTAAASPTTYIVMGTQNVPCDNSGQLQGEIQFGLRTKINDNTDNPMQETGLPSILMAFFVNGNAAPVSVKNIFNDAGSSIFKDNTWNFTLQDDMPNVGGWLNLGACTSGATVAITTVASSSFGNVDNQVSFNGGAVGTVSNGNTKTNIVATTAAVATTTATQTAAATQTAVANQQSTGSIVITFGPELDQNGGQGISTLQCQNGLWTTTINLQASTNVNGIHAYQPMAETGLATIDMHFFLGGSPATVAVVNSFNVDGSTASGNIWTFTMQDDGPHPGGQLTLGSCTAGSTAPQVTVFFSTTSFIQGQGLPNGADGGPPVPAVSGVPTLVNALSPQFVAAAPSTNNVATGSTNTVSTGSSAATTGNTAATVATGNTASTVSTGYTTSTAATNYGYSSSTGSCASTAATGYSASTAATGYSASTAATGYSASTAATGYTASTSATGYGYSSSNTNTASTSASMTSSSTTALATVANPVSAASQVSANSLMALVLTAYFVLVL